LFKLKLLSNPVYQGSASEMILIQFSHPQSVIRERKRGEDWEMIWKRFGDAKHNSQKLERKGEINLPKECLKGFVIRRAIVIIGQADRLLFLFLEGTAQKKKNIGSLKMGSLNSFS
jgi:hypothetical protein